MTDYSGTPEWRAQQRFFNQLAEPCPVPVGARVELTGTQPEDPAPMPVGSRGTVTGGNGSQIFVKWDNGRTLILLATDPYRVVSQE
jgi:hypothetical protein